MVHLVEYLPSLSTLAVAIPTLAVAYILFGIGGFGTALIAAPILAQIMPVSTIVPLLALLDCTAAIINGVTLNEKIDRREIAWLVPLLIAGSLVGAWLLFTIPPTPMLLALGIFVVAYALYSLFAPAPRVGIRQMFVVPFGLIGGVFSAMFGSGGFIYAIYLSRRLQDKDAMRATTSALIAFAGFTRVVIFALAGVYSDWRLPILALLLLPAMLVGLYIGHHVTLRMTREQFLRVLSFVLIGTGTTLIVRALTAGM
jgi:uncharacterized membrane protein YfcA